MFFITETYIHVRNFPFGGIYLMYRENGHYYYFDTIIMFYVDVENTLLLVDNMLIDVLPLNSGRIVNY